MISNVFRTQKKNEQNATFHELASFYSKIAKIVSPVN